MRTARIRPKCENVDEDRGEPLGAEMVGGLLAENGFDVRLFDQYLYARRGEMTRDILEFSPDIAGFSLVTGGDIRETLKIMFDLREKNPGVRFAVGGIFTFGGACSKTEITSRFPRGTRFFAYESEYEFLRYCREEAGIDSPGAFPDEPDKWPRALRPNVRKYCEAGLSVNVQSSRGCVGNCAFCSTAALPAKYRAWRARAPRDLADEIKSIHDRNPETPMTFQFVDDDALGPFPVERANAIADEMSALAFPVTFSFQARGGGFMEDAMDPAMKRLYEAGLRRVFVGVENLDGATLKKWNKNTAPREVLKKMGQYRKIGIEMAAGYITWHPDAELTRLREDMSFLRECGVFTLKTATAVLFIFENTQLAERHRARLTRGKFSWEFSDKRAEVAYNAITEELLPYDDEWAKASFERLKTPEYRDPAACARYEELNDMAFETMMKYL